MGSIFERLGTITVINLLRVSDTYIHHKTGPLSVQIMAYRQNHWWANKARSWFAYCTISYYLSISIYSPAILIAIIYWLYNEYPSQINSNMMFSITRFSLLWVLIIIAITSLRDTEFLSVWKSLVPICRALADHKIAHNEFISYISTKQTKTKTNKKLKK